MGVFGRKKHVRADVSLIESVLGALIQQRSVTGTPVPADELPITQGLVTLIADAIGDMEMYPVDRPGNDPRAQRLPDRFPILEQPDPDEERADTVHKIVQSLFWKGNGWALNGEIGANGAVDAITVLDPNEVGWLPNPDHSLKVRKWTINGREVERGALTWWKINDNPTKGPLGKSPVQICSTALETYGWAYSYLADYFQLGGNPHQVFTSKLDLSPGKITELADEWIRSRQEHRPPFLPSWLDFQVPPTSQELEQVVRVLEFAAAEFARMCNVPVSLVNAPVAGYSLQYSNVGDEFRRWLAVSLGTTWIRRVERGFSQLLPTGVWCKLDPGGLFPADLFPEPAGQPAPQVELAA